MLRAVAQHQATGASPEDLLDVADRRTLVKLLRIGGGTTNGLPLTIDDFLTNQRLIERYDAIAQIRQFLTGSGYAAGDERALIPANHRSPWLMQAKGLREAQMDRDYRGGESDDAGSGIVASCTQVTLD